MFIGDFEQSAPWNTQSIKGCKRFLERVLNLVDILSGEGITPELERPMHKLIKKVTGDIDSMRFNTAIAAMMGTLNTITEVGKITKDELLTFAKLLSPFAPHIAEEINALLGNTDLISVAKWPEYDEAKTVDDTVELPVQINGKVRTTILVSKDADKDAVLAIAMASEKIAEAVAGKTVIKQIVVPGKIVNIVVK
jgi:leucyl-tRNA synthetase